MDNLKTLLVLSLLLSGCASLNSEVFQKIHKGDSAEQVVEILGKPDSFNPSHRVPGGTAWIYSRRSNQCGIVIKDEKVEDMICSEIAYVNPVGAMFSGMGQGLANASQNNVQCTTTNYGYQSTTNCH